MKKQLLPLTLLFTLLLGVYTTRAQEATENFIREHLAQNQYSIDPDAAAVILNEKATVEIMLNNDKYQKRYRCYRLVKILKSSAASEGDVQYVYYNINSYPGKIEGATFNMEGGNISKKPLDKNAVYFSDYGGGFRELKFAMPDVKAGSIIEYSYEVYSDITYQMPVWYFQNEHPALQSEYELVYPTRYQFMSIVQSPMLFKEYTSRAAAFQDNALAYKVSDVRIAQREGMVLWGRRNVPAGTPEPFISSISNHIERLDIQLAGYADHTSVTGITSVISDWKKFTEMLLDDDDLGKPLRERKEYIEDVVAGLTKGTATDLDKAKKIFNYCRSNFECVDTISINVERKLKNVFTGKQGNSAEINLLLIGMLRKAGLDAMPVVLSTLGHVKADDMYPLLSRFNQTICLVNINNERYLLDASNKYNPFGILPVYCYNGYARIVDKRNADSIYISSSMLKEKSINKVSVYGISDTGMDMKIVSIAGMLESKEIRRRLDGKKKNEEDYITAIANSMENGVEIVSYSFENLGNPDTNLVINYEIHYKFDKPVTTLYLQTDYIKFFAETPFKAMQRRLPVELPFQIDYIYSLNIKTPEG